MSSLARIHILNCGTMRPLLPPFPTGVTCLLVESSDGLVLVDTGFGTRDYLQPEPGMRAFLALMRSPRDVSETALHQVQRLGFAPESVHHIFMTHLHVDHAGGLPDFPWAEIHVLRPEYEHISAGFPGPEYNRAHWAHHPRWVCHDLRGDQWLGFDAIRIPDIEPEIWMVPLTGHTPGHSGIAVKDGDHWVLHGGDAVPYNVRVDNVPDWISRMLIGPHVPRIRHFIRANPDVTV
ncbi:MAG: MBL fold metallo-hydrolase, partial [Anaerolineae bacterium]